MKVIIFLLLIVSVFCWQQEQVDRINKANLGWTAQYYDRWEGMTEEELKNYFGVKIPYHPRKLRAEPSTLSAGFDWKEKNPNCLCPVRDQGQCGSCWTFGLTESFADQGCIRGAWSPFVKLSPQDLVSCDTNDYGCDGGYLDRSWEYAEKYGVVTDECFPYVSGDGSVPPCPKKCQDGESWSASKHFVSGFYHVAQSQDTIGATMEKYGPLEVAFRVYQDFLSYKSGVYKWDRTSPYLGGHAVAFVGWGTTSDGTLYWIVQNSWNSSWGINGYFWILRGVNECGIESEVYYGDPKSHA